MIYALLLIIELIFEAKNGDKHDTLSAVRLALAILLAGFVGIAYGNYYGAFLYLGLRFSIFDYAMAILRGQSWDYLGSNIIDSILKNINKWVLLSIRIVVLAITLYYEKI